MTSVTLTRPVVVRESFANAKNVQMVRTIRLRKGFNDLSSLDPEQAARVLDNFVVRGAMPKPKSAAQPDAAAPLVTERPAGGPKPTVSTSALGTASNDSLKPEPIAEPPRNAKGERTDGPTVAEFVAAGFLASNYPPSDYASISTAKEIKAAIEAEKAAGNQGGEPTKINE